MLIIMCIALVATAIVVITHSTSGFVDLATLLVAASAVVTPIVARRKQQKPR